MINTKKLAVPLLTVAMLIGGAGVGIATVASAQSTAAGVTANTAQPGMGHGVAGTVVSVSGNTITLTGKDGTTYTVDAAAATIDKVSTVTVANIAAGDTLMVEGTVSGSSVTASHIMDGKMPEGGFGGRGGPGGPGGRGPGVHGTVSAISGTTLTVTQTNPKDSTTTTYTVDAASAKVMKSTAGAAPTTGVLSDIVVGDTVGIRGSVSGTTVTATDIMDGVPPMHGERGPAPQSQTNSQ